MSTIRELTRLSNGKELDIQYPIMLHDKEGKIVYYEDFDGFWCKGGYQEGKVVFYENSFGGIINNIEESK